MSSPSILTARRRANASGKRWQTTTHCALEETAKNLYDIDRNALLKSMSDRKISNNKTSISFGTEKVITY